VIDPEDIAAREEAASKLFSGPVDFLRSAPQLQFLPDPVVPEIAFCGRSNVGKSSLLNALVGRKAIARASVTPGRTQELNFFDVGRPRDLAEDEVALPLFRLVDMPGYGFAKAPIKVVDKWKALVNSYLRGRQVLTRTLVLVDSRHGIKEVDRAMMKMLDEAAVGYRVVLTKTDKIKASELAEVAEKTAAEVRKHIAAFPELHLTSSEKGMGLAALRAAVVSDALGAEWIGG
jgi:GTP-binding protein